MLLNFYLLDILDINFIIWYYNGNDNKVKRLNFYLLDSLDMWLEEMGEILFNGVKGVGKCIFFMIRMER